MPWVAGVVDNFYCPPLTLPGIEILDGSELGPVDELDHTYFFEDLRDHAKSFQPPEGKEALSCLLPDCVGVCGPC